MNRRLLAEEPTLFSFVYQASPKNVSIQQATQAIRQVMLASEVVDKKTETLPKTELTWSEDMYEGVSITQILISIGAAVAVVVVIVICCWCRYKKLGKKKQSDAQAQTKKGSGTGQPLVIPISIDHAKYG
jgi:hypothetical protein